MNRNLEEILVVDDDESLRSFLSDLIIADGHSVWKAGSAEEVLEELKRRNPVAALIDLVLPGIGGLDLLARIKHLLPKTEVILMTSHASLETAIEALHKGAYGYLRKPFESPEEVVNLLQRALEKRRLLEENERLQGDLEQKNSELTATVHRLSSLIEAGRAMSAIYEIKELLDFFIELVVKELHVNRASLMLMDQNGEMRIVASRGIDHEVAQSVLVRLGEGIAGWVAENGKPILVKDIQPDPRLLAKDHARYPHHSFISAPIVLSIPIKLQEKVLGVINVTNKGSGVPFSDDDLAFLYSLAGQAAVAIEGARHFEELKEAYTELQFKDRQIISSERLNALGQMATGVAHDFNNLLNGIMGRAQLLLRQTRQPGAMAASMEEDLRWVERLAEEGAEIVKRIQEFTGLRKDTPFVATDLNQLIRDSVAMTRPKWKDQAGTMGLEIDVRYDLQEIPKTSAAPHDLIQVFSNLIFNAVEGMPQGGALTLRTSLEDKAILCQVMDEGVGMTEPVQKQIFEPFFTTKPEGKGLGLSIVYGIVKRHGGSIEVNSQLGKGSIFSLRFPVVSSRPQAPRIDASKQSTIPVRILLVEDDNQNRLLFERILTQQGHFVSSASSGKEGLALFCSDRFDLVITDLSMPGLSGLGVAKEVKKVASTMPVLLVSGWGMQLDAEVMAAGVDLVLSKPCSIEELCSAVDKIILKKGDLA